MTIGFDPLTVDKHTLVCATQRWCDCPDCAVHSSGCVMNRIYGETCNDLGDPVFPFFSLLLYTRMDT